MKYSQFNDQGVVKWARRRHRHFAVPWGGKCGHRYCSICKTRKGNNIGNRRLRRKAQQEIRNELR